MSSGDDPEPTKRPARRSNTRRIISSSSEEDSEPIKAPGRQPRSAESAGAPDSSPSDRPVVQSSPPEEQPSSPPARAVPHDVVEISSDDSETPLSRHVRPSRGKNPVPTADSSEQDQVAGETTTMEIEEGDDSELSNLEKFKRVRDNVYVKAGRNVDRIMNMSNSSNRLQHFLKGPKYQSRKSWLDSVTKNNKGNTWIVKVRSDPGDDSFPATNGINFNISQDDFSRAEATALAKDIVKVLDRLPLIIDNKMARSNALQVMVLTIAIAAHAPEKTMKRNQVQWIEHKGQNSYYRTHVWYFDKETGEPAKTDLNIPLYEDPTLHERIPDVPDNITFDLRALDHKVLPPQPKDEGEKNRHKASVKFAKFLSWKMAFLVATRDEMYQVRGEYEELLGIRAPKKNKAAFYHGKPFCQLKSSGKYGRTSLADPDQCRIEPSTFVKKDIVGNLPDIILNSGLQNRTHRVITTMHESWYENRDVLKAWKAGCVAADLLNANKGRAEIGDTVCACDEAISKTTAHFCHRCSKPTLCCTLSLRVGGIRWCQDCEQTWEGAVRDTEMNPSLRRMKYEIRKLLWSESIRVGKGKDYDKDLYAECVKALYLQARDPASYTWEDAYSTNLRVDVNPLKAGKGPYVDPFFPSIDAALPYSEWQELYYVHCPDNVVVTAWYLNAAKHVFIPATLTLVAEYCSSNKSSADRQTLVAKMDIVHEIGIKTPYKKAARVNAPFDFGKLEQDRAEWKETILLPSKNSPWKPSLYSYTRAGDQSTFYVPDWRPKGHARLLKVIGQIEEKFGKKLPRRNGCPYFLSVESLPDKWCWYSCWKLLEARIDTMRYWCNNKWETIDTIETIYLECIWQVLDPELGDLFGLPLTPWARHPLRFAVAHLLHGKQMQTGWLTESPADIADHDTAANNISIETCFTNYAKSNIPSDRYPELQKDIKAVSVGKKWHVRSSKEGTRAEAEAGAELEEFLDENIDDSEDMGWDAPLSDDDVDVDEVDDDDPPPAGASSSKGKPSKAQANPSASKASSSKTTKGSKSKPRVSSSEEEESDDPSPAFDRAAADENDASSADEMIDDDRVDNYRAAFVERFEDEAPLASGQTPEASVTTFIVKQLQKRLRALLKGNQNTVPAIVERVIIRRILEAYGETPVG